MKEVFLHIDQIITDNVTEIRFFDFDLGQFEKDPPPVSWPAVLFKFNTGTFTDLSAGVQEVQSTVTLRVGFKLYERTHSKGTNREAALAHLDVLKALSDAITASSSSSVSSISRTGLSEEVRADYRIYNLTFEIVSYEGPDDMPYIPPGDLDPPVEVGFCYNIVVED